MEVSCFREFRGHTVDVNFVSWSPVDQKLVSCSGDKTVRIWDLTTGRDVPPSPLIAHSLHVNACVFSPSGDLLATVSSDTSVKLWSTTTWTLIGTLSGHSGSVRCCAFSPDGNLLATGSADESVRVWEVSTLRCVTTFSKHESNVVCCSFAPNGWLLATGGSTGEIIFSDAFSGGVVGKHMIHDLGVNTIVMAPQQAEQGETYVMVTAGNDNKVKLWNVTIQQKRVIMQVRATLSSHSAPVHTCAFSPDGMLLASGSVDCNIIIWDMVSLQPKKHLKAHDRFITHCAFSPDGHFLASASNDKVIKVWKLNSSGLDSMAPSPSPSRSDSSSSAQGGLIKTQRWSLDEVCGWVEAIKRQMTSGDKLHPGDGDAVSRLAKALGDLGNLCTSTPRASGDDFKCPITQQTMVDPVVASDGFTYERSAIMAWLGRGQRTSPVTNLPLTSGTLLPNRHLKALIGKAPPLP